MARLTQLLLKLNARFQDLNIFRRVLIVMFPLLVAAILILGMLIRWLEVYSIQNPYLWLFFVPFAFAFICAYLIARYTEKEIGAPIKLFIESAKEVARGNFDHQVNIHTTLEISQLSKIFNYMTVEVKRIHQININQIIREKIKTEAILRNIADGVMVVGPSLEVLLINEVMEDWFNYREKDIIGCSANFFFPDLKFFISQAFSEGDMDVTREEIELYPESSAIPMIVGAHASKVFDRKELVALVIVLRNITKEKDVDRLKTELVNIVAHELRSPLTSIAGFSEILKNPEIGDIKRREFTEIIHYESGRLAEMINKFLDISRIESGKTMVNKFSMDITTAITNVLNINLQLAQKRKITVKTYFPETIPMVLADPDLIEQVILNLFSNAVKYSPENSDITISLKVLETKVAVQIQDRGFGISKENQKHLFEKFFRAKDEKHVKETEGTGLGLAFVKEIIHQHDGTVHVESLEGKGSTFSFTLPIFQSEAQPLESAPVS